MFFDVCNFQYIFFLNTFIDFKTVQHSLRVSMSNACEEEIVSMRLAAENQMVPSLGALGMWA